MPKKASSGTPIPGSLSSVGESADGTDLLSGVSSGVCLARMNSRRLQPRCQARTLPEQYLDLPNDITPVLNEEALAITNGATNRYEQAKMLQDHFRQFDYSVNLSVRRGDPIEQFLDERVGFCQQFSGTMALMARSLGIPARVAIGFTGGDPIAGEPNTYQITGRHTHAWPRTLVWRPRVGGLRADTRARLTHDFSVHGRLSAPRLQCGASPT